MLDDHDPEELKKIAESYLRVIKEDICTPCVEHRGNLRAVNLDDPLQCKCSCKKVEQTLQAARDYLKLSKPK
ncbi:hypothetical protein MTBPR1_10217 [Candidatus Terasakiella magnetica]|uniref:Uncharacterized protein n=1 Tax=Candidatus Terasakiella magnetica TaxID=1867952 RepID=A0A1C3RCH2_9PROT|nr:hypothetical protein [Candidatus Terasakiella magnetica]SCA54970.1 hypothetical protein MTBPR1_10217 [Candidatus Terasakiella magnetica]